MALAGVGAFPLKVTGLRGRSDRSDLESVLTSISGSLEPGELPTVLAAQEFREDELSSLLASSGNAVQDDEFAPDYLTAACGLALGLGLTTGPLFPDVLALIASRSPRWRRGLPSRASISEGDAASGRASGIGGSWLQSALASRIRGARR